MTKIWLYRVDITKDKNAKIDQISVYLSLHGRTETNAIEAQYQQIALHKNIKLDLAQSQVGKANYNYLEIYQDDKSFYFFIDKATWKSTSTVDFELTLDTVNTFANDFTFNKKTKINRQHKDRLKGKLYIDENSLPVYDAIEDAVGHTYVIANEWLNEGFDTTHLYTDDEPGQMTLIKYQNNKKVGEWQNLWFIGRVADQQTGYYYWQAYDYDGDLFYYSDEEMKADNANGIYWAIRFDDYQEILQGNSAWPSLFVGEAKFRYLRLVDQLPEGINPPQFKVKENKIEDATNNNWYLVYQSLSADEDSGVSCQLWPENATNVKVLGRTLIKPEDLNENIYYYIMPDKGLSGNNWHNTYNFKYGNTPQGAWGETLYLEVQGTRVNNPDLIWHWWNIRPQYKNPSRDTTDAYDDECKMCDFAIIWKKKNSANQWVIRCEFCKAYETGFGEYKESNSRVIWAIETEPVGSTSGADAITFGNVPWSQDYEVKYYYSASYSTSLKTLSQNWDKNDSWSHSAWTFADITYQLKSFYDLTRTDSKLIKIIKVPYNFVAIDENGTLMSNDWVVSSDHLVLQNKNAKFISGLKSELNPVEPLLIEATDKPGSDINRKDIYESKVYNSEFYVPKFVYDSFNYQHLLETVDIDKVDFDSDFNIEYQATTTINSRFLFKFNVPLKLSTADYDNICIAVRNNELPIYSNNYLNYVRTGYNYDIKNKNAQLAKDTTGLVASAAGSALGLGIAGAKVGASAGSAGGPWGAVIGAAGGLIIGAAAGFINLAINQSQADNAIKQKLDEASRQATTVAGGDDIDLLDNYTGGNKAKYVIYSCSDKVKQAMLDLFYYCGYKDDVYGVPNLNSRRWFNYIECVPVFNEEADTPYKEYLDDIKERYQAGITVYHRVGYSTYDLNQEKENWEKSLY